VVALRSIKNFLLLLLSFLLFFCIIPGSSGQEKTPREFLYLEIEGMITAGEASFIRRELGQADPAQFQAAIIRMDTPGGLLEATLDLNFGSASIPVIVFVAPSGAIAASAGAFILVSSDIAAMSPGTTVGAAMPVALSPGGVEQADDKTVNFFAGHIKSIAREKGRPAELAERFVTENLTLDALEAQEEGIIDLTAENTTVLLKKLDGYELEKNGLQVTLATGDARLVPGEMNLQERFHARVSDPQLSYLLLVAGALGLFFGLGMPGTFVPEVLGSLALLLGIYGFDFFDTGTTGVIFLVLGFSLVLAEIFTAGFGILGIGGGVGILIGSIMLPQELLMAVEWYASFRAAAAGIALAVILLSFLIVTVVARSRRQWKESGSFFRAASTAVVAKELNPWGTVKMRGELWRAYSEDGSSITEGCEVDVLRQEGLTLIVRAKTGEE